MPTWRTLRGKSSILNVFQSISLRLKASVEREAQAKCPTAGGPQRSRISNHTSFSERRDMNEQRRAKADPQSREKWRKALKQATPYNCDTKILIHCQQGGKRRQRASNSFHGAILDCCRGRGVSPLDTRSCLPTVRLTIFLSVFFSPLARA